MYYVVSDDGQKYGPADLDTLHQWVGENRLTREMLLENADNGVQMKAGDVPGLFTEEDEAPAADPGVVGDGPEPNPFDPLSGGAAGPADSPVDAREATASQVIEDDPQPAGGAQSGPYSAAPKDPYAPANPYDSGTTNYPRYDNADPNVQTYVTWGWVCAVLSCCCLPGAIGAIILGNKAKNAGHAQGQAIFIIGIIMTALNAIGFVLQLLFGFAGAFLPS
jgi:hypothetical protein